MVPAARCRIHPSCLPASPLNTPDPAVFHLGSCLLVMRQGHPTASAHLAPASPTAVCTTPYAVSPPFSSRCHALPIQFPSVPWGKAPPALHIHHLTTLLQLTLAYPCPLPPLPAATMIVSTSRIGALDGTCNLIGTTAGPYEVKTFTKCKGWGNLLQLAFTVYGVSG